MITVEFCDFYRLYEKSLDIFIKLKYNNNKDSIEMNMFPVKGEWKQPGFGHMKIGFRVMGKGVDVV